jgi:L-alanine-DL-glutamate epimerase-like enolase superfamily enzyme
MSTYELLAELPVAIDGYELEGHEVAFSEEFVRKTTVIRLRGAGEEGLGEDVTYAAEDQEALQRAGASETAELRSLAGEWTLASLAAHLRTLDLFPQPTATTRPEFRLYRYWAFDSAALDLSLRQAGTTLHAALGRECPPLRFVASLRLGEPPSLAPLQRRLEIAPGLRFKLDPTPSWDDELVARLVALGAVDSVDLKGQYEGTIVDNPADPALYRRVVEAFPDAWIEDPKLTPETEEVLRPHRARVTWDAPLHSVADIETLPWQPRTINVKPSRFGGLKTLLDVYDHCAAQEIGCYGGGQSELSVGRGQIQYLASLFHADAPNDVAPAGFNLPEPPPDLPSSPLAPAPSALGFRWG